MVSASEIEAEGSVAIQHAIDSIDIPGAVVLPPGEFTLTDSLRMRSGVVLRGAGRNETILAFDPPPLPKQSGLALARGAIQFQGERIADPIALSAGFGKGSTTLVMGAASDLKAGDLILVFSENDPDLMYTDPRWNTDWAQQSIAQIVTVVECNENTVTIDTPLRLNYRAALQPRIQKIEPLENAGLEGMSITRVDADTENIIGIEASANCWVRDCETSWTRRGHIWINFSRFITIEGNEVHHAHSYAGGGNGYGIVAGNVATDCLIVNNIIHHMRHALMAKRGSNGNVFAYNYSFERRLDSPRRKGDLLCDVSIHGHYSYANLFEGNIVEFVELADYWGPTGPGTTFFRNRVKTHIAITDHSDGTLVIANLMGSDLKSDGTSKNLTIEGNVTPKSGPTPKNYPASLYFNSPPPFWGDLPWPMSIDSAAEGPYNPAQARWMMIN